MPRKKLDLEVKSKPRSEEWQGKNIVRYLKVAHEAAREGDYATAEKWTNMASKEMDKLKNQRSENMDSQTLQTVAAILPTESVLKENEKRKKKKPKK